MVRYFLLLISVVLLLFLFTCSGYQYESISAQAIIDEALIFDNENSYFAAAAPTTVPTPVPVDPPSSFDARLTIIPQETEAPSSEKQSVESEDPVSMSGTTESKEQIADIPDWYESTERGIKVPILMYHNLLAGSVAGDGLNVSEEAFEDQMHTLKSYGYNTITFNDLYEHYMYGSSLPDNPVIITFDDGYASNYTIGYPILKKYGFSACIFIITNAIGNSGYLSESQLREMASGGLIDIQNHSVSHSYYLPGMSESKIDSELSDSKNRLESITGSNVNIFCYPIGRYSQRLIGKLIEHGYIFSVTTKYGLASKEHNPFLLRRIRVMGSDSGIELKAKIEKLTKRITRFIGIPEETITPEPSPEPYVEPEPQQSEEPDQEQSPGTEPSTGPEQPGQTTEQMKGSLSEPVPDESPGPDSETSAPPEPGPVPDSENEENKVNDPE